ncbi:hypothetical protein P152DRAFT_183633 [Eremomyces bilateralis CBS 781.70]|uniref:Uncharacterized protein n=1 Tax=Eremomyces bilateralis CBS 781.70 TaxID=1392243 RepID=A0A6G1GBM9_9PEZI|nr:uncharacterized protein P152DRAFT_183633 [Eremomyces bilateralis CBS 781.70]KAF1815382.1 hypothetical protein P152DRAFT_183633 [Eremomyces bilateralis CBS 781.70]
MSLYHRQYKLQLHMCTHSIRFPSKSRFQHQGVYAKTKCTANHCAPLHRLRRTARAPHPRSIVGGLFSTPRDDSRYHRTWKGLPRKCFCGCCFFALFIKKKKKKNRKKARQSFF